MMLGLLLVIRPSAVYPFVHDKYTTRILMLEWIQKKGEMKGRGGERNKIRRTCVGLCMAV